MVHELTSIHSPEWSEEFVKVAETGSEHDAHESKSDKPRASSLRTMLPLRDKQVLHQTQNTYTRSFKG